MRQKDLSLFLRLVEEAATNMKLNLAINYSPNETMKFLAFLIAIFATAAAFAPRASRMSSHALAMKVEQPAKVILPAAALSLLGPVAAMAAEGTGRALGFDDSRLIWAALAPSFLIFPLYLQWSKQQERDDFFDGYEKRRSG